MKCAEDALRESEERFRGTFENAAVGMAHCDGEGRVIRVNEKFCTIIGYPRAEMVGKTFLQMTHPDDLAADLAQFSRLMQGELSSYHMEKRFIGGDGAIVWTQVTASLQRDSAGQPAYCIKVLEEISERKRLEEELRQANTRLELAVRGSNVRIWDIHIPSGEAQNAPMHTVNFWEHLGYGSEIQSDTATALALVHPDDQEAARRAARACLSGDTKAFQAEYRARHTDGTYRWMLSRGVVVRDQTGSPVRFIGSDVDITDLKTAEKALRESEERFRGTFDNAAVGIAHIDAESRCLRATRRCATFLATRARN